MGAQKKYNQNARGVVKAISDGFEQDLRIEPGITDVLRTRRVWCLLVVMVVVVVVVV